MGSIIEVNDTLMLTRDQGFPFELNYERHVENPINVESLHGKVFDFKDKSDIRLYHGKPVRVFLAERKGDKTLYWGRAEMIELTYDFLKRTTSGRYVISYIYTPEEMQTAFHILDAREETNFLQVGTPIIDPTEVSPNDKR